MVTFWEVKVRNRGVTSELAVPVFSESRAIFPRTLLRMTSEKKPQRADGIAVAVGLLGVSGGSQLLPLLGKLPDQVFD
jgi:hypothetical protein